MHIAIDFDGVICSNHERDYNQEVMLRKPIAGAYDFIKRLLTPENKVSVYSARARTFTGVHTIQDYLTFVVGLSYTEISTIDISDKKPIADIYIDDRAIRFEGTWPTHEELKAKSTNWLGQGTNH